jgi:hypothetical protein
VLLNLSPSPSHMFQELDGPGRVVCIFGPPWASGEVVLNDILSRSFFSSSFISLSFKLMLVIFEFKKVLF